MSDTISHITRFVFELLHMKRIRNEGIRLIGVEQPNSIAEHSFTAAQIGYVLAKMEGADANRVAAMLIWHDMPEIRIGDIHKIGGRYLTGRKAAEEQILSEQTRDIPFGEDIRELWTACEEREGREGIIAKDADYLDHAFIAKTYLERGYADAEVWIANVGKVLRTESAKSLYVAMNEGNTSDWWRKAELMYIPEIGKV